MAVRRPAVRRHPAARSARPAGAHAADAEPRHSQRGCALGRPRGQQPVRAQPLSRLRPVGGRLARHLRLRLVARTPEPVDRDHHRPELPVSAQPGHFPGGHRPYRTVFSDIVGRTRIRYGRFIDLTHRFRLDKDNFAVRRNEIDLDRRQRRRPMPRSAICGSTATSIRRSRICATRRSCALAGRVLFHRYWSVFGATVHRPHRQERRPAVAGRRVGSRCATGSAFEYEDECLELGLTWRRDYERIGAFRKGSTFALHLALKGSAAKAAFSGPEANGRRLLAWELREILIVAAAFRREFDARCGSPPVLAVAASGRGAIAQQDQPAAQPRRSVNTQPNR